MELFFYVISIQEFSSLNRAKPVQMRLTKYLKQMACNKGNIKCMPEVKSPALIY